MVEWKKLGEVGTFENIGTDKKIVEGEDIVTLLNYVDVYHHKYIDSSVPQMQVSASSKKIADCTVEKGDIFVTPSSETVDDIGHSSVITETISNAVYSYHIMRYRLFEKNMLLSYYINYSFDTDNVKRQILKKAQGLTRFGLSKDKFASILIPIPSLSEQQRIVGILDTFTSAIDNLKEQIAQRRKQYEYYRDQLLDLEGKEGVEMKTLGEIGDVCMCKRIMKDQTSDKGDVPFYKIGTFGAKADAYISRELFEEYKSKYSYPALGEILISASGTIGRAIVFDGMDSYFQDSNIVWIANNEKIVTNRYLYYFYQIADWKTDGGTIKRLYNYNLKNTTIPVPSLQEQQRIVSILDTFEASIANLEAQLKEREKQYEYYRNQLLTFE